MKVVEVFPGSSTHANAEFIQLQLPQPGENATSGSSVTVHSATGAVVATFPLSNVTDGDQRTILLATDQAMTDFETTRDVSMGTDAVIPEAGGKVCFNPVAPLYSPPDCVSWGTYSGSITGAGNPFNPSGGLALDQVLARRTAANRPCDLDTADDTDDSATNFMIQFGSPRPHPNSATPPSGGCAREVAGVLKWTADPGVNNNLALVPGTDDYTLSDTGGPIQAGDGCEPVSSSQARCLKTGVTAIKLKSGDRGDQMQSNLFLSAPLVMDGGDGGDELIAQGAEADTLKGGNGNDELEAFDGVPSNDTLNCGAGTDEFTKDSGDVKKDCEIKVT